ncbi:hypothetical protein L6452_28430 [Arctium lappa]|uniref:Uncharacterized protein n=1 Tax=Arctium lappa TaxID=4217 RepID=A0ACB8ZY83_ARCLA|nr:hypothetical protein L6452_28430 [Arctium lappa]
MSPRPVIHTPGPSLYVYQHLCNINAIVVLSAYGFPVGSKVSGLDSMRLHLQLINFQLPLLFRSNKFEQKESEAGKTNKMESGSWLPLMEWIER